MLCAEFSQSGLEADVSRSLAPRVRSARIRLASVRACASEIIGRPMVMRSRAGPPTRTNVFDRTDTNAEPAEAVIVLEQQLAARANQSTETRYALQQLPILSAEKIRSIRNDLSEVDVRIAELDGRRAYVLSAPIAGRAWTNSPCYCQVLPRFFTRERDKLSCRSTSKHYLSSPTCWEAPPR
jgi:hypothetical protein